MQISSALNKIIDINDASVVMGTEANLQRIIDAGFGVDIIASPNDLVIAVKGEESACIKAIEHAEELLTAKPIEDASQGFSQPINSLSLGLEQHPESNLALISVPGDYAAAEAIKALNLGLNVMMFSDNVSIRDEQQIKLLAQQKGLLVMGPDCGTAIINGIPLGFANVVRTGKIAVVAASGTGMQEATCRIHQLGEGISQAIGTGGHDLHLDIGGISMLQGLNALADDPKTDVIVLISKPPAESIAKNIITQASKINKPVVINFLGSSEIKTAIDGVYFADTLVQAAEMAVAILHDDDIQANDENCDLNKSKAAEYAATLTPDQKYIRGVFAGGTFCYESQIVAQKHAIQAYSNTPSKDNKQLENVWHSQQHTIVDLGDDEFTQGRPHPMIDPTLRNQRILQEARDQETAIVLFDVVLGYGASEEPIIGLLDVLKQVKDEQQTAPLFIAHVCGTDLDPQSRDLTRQLLADAGVLLAESNADASHLSSHIISQLSE
ncbi:acyl-CoA synthetase FdrA [Vibrio algarum]|uniref:Acyl-CoA synthetase FdrA n=1 Tax=Vibrio algarum TaxID=3020714 RepID=A0ABT4YV39_9VIBR|nr:acyl-CoA synthetase FdrA [Vibrio sp. KJ40-1]MDB1125450.1 acyl-CoA synthetase FdrA [Vibrio sp. KJ40-1]